MLGDCKDAFIKSRTVIKLVEYGATIDDDSEITKRFNEILLKKLREVEMAIIKYKNHPSTKAITNRMKKLS